MEQNVLKIEIPVKFNIGDIVWVREDAIYNKESMPCDVCSGVGSIQLLND